MSKYNFSEIKDWAHQVHFYEHDAWMRDYPISEVGEYLQLFHQVESGERVWFEQEQINNSKHFARYPSRADFIVWKCDKENHGLQQSK